METTSSKETFAVMVFRDLFGSGYHVQPESEIAVAKSEGWDVLVENLDRETADHIARIYKYAGQSQTANDLSDMGLEHDYTDYQEDRDNSSVQLFDTVYVPVFNPDECDEDERADMRGALWVEGVITDMTEDEIELDGYLSIDRNVAMKYGYLTCKAIADCGYVVEYNEYLDRLQENKESLYAIAVQIETALSNEMVA